MLGGPGLAVFETWDTLYSLSSLPFVRRGRLHREVVDRVKFSWVPQVSRFSRPGIRRGAPGSRRWLALTWDYRERC